MHHILLCPYFLPLSSCGGVGSAAMVRACVHVTRCICVCFSKIVLIYSPVSFPLFFFRNADNDDDDDDDADKAAGRAVKQHNKQGTTTTRFTIPILSLATPLRCLMPPVGPRSWHNILFKKKKSHSEERSDRRKHVATRGCAQVWAGTHQSPARGTVTHSKEDIYQMDELVLNQGKLILFLISN